MLNKVTTVILLSTFVEWALYSNDCNKNIEKNVRKDA